MHAIRPDTATWCVAAPRFVVRISSPGLLVVPIYRLLKKHAFSPDQIEVLSTAFEAALRELGLVDRNDPAAQLIASALSSLRSEASGILYGCQVAVKGDASRF